MVAGAITSVRARTAAPRHRRRLLRMGLRGRVTLGFGLLALALSGLLALVVGVLVSNYLQGQRRSSAIEQTGLSAASLDRVLATSHADVPGLLDAAPANDRVSSLLNLGGAWYTTSLAAGPSVLPPELVAMVNGGTAATQRISAGGRLFLAVGTPLRGKGNSYYELFGLDDLDRTYRVLSLTLMIAAVATAGLGLLAGRVVSGRVLRPVTELNAAAALMAKGDVGARLDAEDDPDLGELAQSFNRTAEALDRRVVADARFAGDVSHELRTPLTTMLNSMVVLQNHRDEVPEALREPMDLLADDLHRFRRLVVDLLEISRDEGGPEPDLMEPVVIGDLVRTAAASVVGHDVTTVSAAANGLRILADKRRLERVVVDLVENAQVHGGGCIGVAVHASEGRVRIVVDDAGPGIPEQRRDRVFERFAREESGARASDGVGLGLAIVARHARWHGGVVEVQDRPGGGARFVVDLPARQP